MNDDFLYNNRPPVRKAFAQNLYFRLSQMDVNKSTQPEKVYFTRYAETPVSKWKFFFSVFMTLTVIALVLLTFEPVRARALEWIKVVAGFSVEERTESPLAAVAQGEDHLLTPTAAANQAATVTAAPTFAPTIYDIPALALSDVLDNPPFQFNIPTWIPDGFTLDQTAGVATSQDWVLFVWNNPVHSEIEMLVEREYTGYRIPAGENSSEEILINNKPALLIRGFWNAQHQWDPKRGISLDWEKDGHHYHLNYFERDTDYNEIKPIEGDMETIIHTLVKMAESIP